MQTNDDLCRSLNTSVETKSGNIVVTHNTPTTKFARCQRPQIICMKPRVKDMPKSRRTHHMGTW